MVVVAILPVIFFFKTEINVYLCSVLRIYNHSNEDETYPFVSVIDFFLCVG